jgi:hypothetical protein
VRLRVLIPVLVNLERECDLQVRPVIVSDVDGDPVPDAVVRPPESHSLPCPQACGPLPLGRLPCPLRQGWSGRLAQRNSSVVSRQDSFLGEDPAAPDYFFKLDHCDFQPRQGEEKLPRNLRAFGSRGSLGRARNGLSALEALNPIMSYVAAVPHVCRTAPLRISVFSEVDPVRVKKTRQNQESKPRFDSVNEKVLAFAALHPIGG